MSRIGLAGSSFPCRAGWCGNRQRTVPLGFPHPWPKGAQSRPDPQSREGPQHGHKGLPITQSYGVAILAVQSVRKTGFAMHSRLLRHFLGVVEKRNISAAAETLHISQPALTRSIRQLERAVGVPLFERLPTGVALTKQVEVLSRRVKLMELEYRHALAEISALEQGMAGTLRIGGGP